MKLLHSRNTSGSQACRSDMVPCAKLALLPRVAATMAKLINCIDFRNIYFLLWLMFSVTSLLNCFFGRKPHASTSQKASTSLPALRSCSDHFIGKQGRNESDSDQTGKEDQIGNLLDPNAQPGQMRIPDRKV